MTQARAPPLALTSAGSPHGAHVRDVARLIENGFQPRWAQQLDLGSALHLAQIGDQALHGGGIERLVLDSYGLQHGNTL
eukprot:CAMPEP_0181241096 /NCGR_PEP_ID=MMETSP1096-20121128/40912_1 /TAXON_ID=156174 ORGANISM="Chrysochromulina ericina, Strain CCMP281" /NCGR_SAMPLE_ID=MMETSP1096 /ASSEMBLY_ACC=CAM_ASM_000453 /LENGTH=78 /DNA_ID=CAMNT_0023337091 /DNA_START=168 /DNA_END=405 /DNA_ORIENTATION=+